MPLNVLLAAVAHKLHKLIFQILVYNKRKGHLNSRFNAQSTQDNIGHYK
jgi:hypothetical protein